MEQHSLTKKDYAEIHRIVSEKRAVKEMIESLKAQLSTSIMQEDLWWQKMAKKHELDTQNDVHSISHATQEILAMPRPKRNTPESVATPEQPQASQEIKVRERTPEMNKLVSNDELEAMRKSREVPLNES